MIMKIQINPSYGHLRDFVTHLPELFEGPDGHTLHDVRNKVRAFDIAGEAIVVKRFKRPNAFNTVMYSYFRKSKARRAYEYALRLCRMGFDSPEPIAWCECRRRSLIGDTYLVSRRSDYRALTVFAERFPAKETLPVLDAFARYAARLHAKGVEHQDFNQGNILIAADPSSQDGYAFQLIDINRMRFHGGPLTQRRCMINLRRLSCPGAAYLYILDRYAEARGWNIDDTLLRGAVFRLLFWRKQCLKYNLRHRKFSHRSKKQPRSFAENK